jgi:hypothetical protein
MSAPEKRKDFDWSKVPLYPNPDYLSSSRKRLLPQMIYKGGILSAWGKKTAVALHKNFFNTLPTLPEVDSKDATLAWMIYDLSYDQANNRYDLKYERTVHTLFRPALERVSNPEPGQIENFINILQAKLDEKLEDNNPPDAPSLTDVLNT